MSDTGNKNDKEMNVVEKKKQQTKSKALIKTSYIFKKLKAALDNQPFESADSDSDDDDKKKKLKRSTLHDHAPYDLHSSQVEPVQKKVKTQLQDKYFNSTSPPSFNFGPFSPLDARPKQTYLRPNPKLNADRSMGPPEPRKCKTPYQTAKDALAFLTDELGILTLVPPGEEAESENTAIADEHSLLRVGPDSFFTVEEVLQILKSLEEEDRVQDNADGRNANVMVDSNDHGPTPLISRNDAMKITFDFIDKFMESESGLNEKDFLGLQRDLQLPAWLGLYELCQKESMGSVVDFIASYFANSKVADKKH